MTENFFDKIRSLPIEQVISKYVELKRKGVSMWACCPFHGEKTASFSVSPAKNIYKCFGCGAGGDAIGFVMEYEKLGFIDACKSIARQHGIPIPDITMSDEQRQAHERTESLRIVLKKAAAWFEENLYKPENKHILDYAKTRWSETTIREFGMGFAPEGWHNLQKWAEGIGIKRDALIAAGLIKVSDKDSTNVFDVFRNRLIIPVTDHLHRITGFTGRAFNTEDAKYLNTPETELFNKGNMLFGFSVARRHIADKGFAILVEGNADVIRMHQIGVLNTVASQGTSLTEKQIALLGSVTSSVTVIGDSDNAGQSAMIKNSKALTTSGIFVNIIPLPVSDNKADPDSFFSDKDMYDDYANHNIVSFLTWHARSKKEKAKSNDRDAAIISEVCNMLSYLPETQRNLQLEELAKIIKPKKVWVTELKKAITNREDKPAFVVEEELTPVQRSSVIRYGFYEEDNCYFFAVKASGSSKKSYVEGSNFIMRPLFHIPSVSNAKRLFEITNKFKYRQVIELEQKDLVSLAAFKLRIESLGNFLWSMSDTYLGKLKSYLYEQTLTCEMIQQLGWQKPGFFAWSNGIYVPANGFSETDNYGIVEHNNVNYYLPAFSIIYKNEPSLFVFERKFKHTNSDVINLYDYVVRLRNVFGDNALVAFSFLLATLFRDIIANRFGFFPLLNCFGPKGAGKTEMAISLTSFFGNVGKGPNINNTSKAALGDHVSQCSNSIVHIDEYRNDIEIEKIEFLKGIWDGTGRSRMNMDKDKKKETTAVDCGVVLTGQQMPTTDIALFSRLVYITFYQTEYSEAEKAAFVDLKDIEKHGLTHLTNQILAHRKTFAASYSANYDAVCNDLFELLPKGKVEDRIFRNWAVIIAAARTLIPVLSLPFSYNDLLSITEKAILVQAAETTSSNELSVFWHLVQYMDNEGMIFEEADYRIELLTKVRTDKGDLNFRKPILVLNMHFGRVINLYRKLGAQQHTNILPEDSIRRYLQNSPYYLGKRNAMRFIKVDRNNQPVYVDGDIDNTSGFQEPRKIKDYITTAYSFRYDEIGIDLSFSRADDDFVVEPVSELTDKPF